MDVLEQYIDKVLTFIDVDIVIRSNLKITMDCGNGVQSLVAPLIGKKLGCEVLIINGYIDPNFSAKSVKRATGSCSHK